MELVIRKYAQGITQKHVLILPPVILQQGKSVENSSYG